MKRRKVDHAALAAKFQRQGEAALYDTDEGTAVARRPATFVPPPAAPAGVRQLPTQDTVQQVDVLPAASVQTVVRTSQKDHSWGFLIRVLPLAAAFAVAAAVVVVGVFEVPAMSMKTIVTTFTVFAGVYLWAFLKDLDASPAGIALRHTRELWKHIHAERKFRHKWYQDERKELRR